MKTNGMSQQLEALRRMEGKEYYALFMQQGTGKTWCFIADAERLYAAGKIDAMFVLTLNGVHINWTRREIPTHAEFPALIAREWRAGMGKRARARLDDLLKPREDGDVVPLRVLSMNIDAVNTKDGFEFAERFLRSTRAYFVVDESDIIKSLEALRTKRVMRLRHLAPYRRIGTGTPVTKNPADVFAQMEFLEPGLLGTTSYRSFVAEYSELMPLSTAAEAIKKIRTGQPTTEAERIALNSIGWGMRQRIERNPKMAYAQMVQKAPDGTPKYRNLEKLQRLLEPHSFRVLKTDCLDLPEKIYQTHYFELDSKQLKAYELLRDELRIHPEELDEPMPVSRLAALVKLQQITSGFVAVPGREELTYVSENNPRLAALMDIVERIEGKFIVWARFVEELRQIAQALRAAGIETVEYHGAVNSRDREAAVDGMQSGTARAFVGNAQSAGAGLTITAASTVIYYSNNFNLRDRLQSEDRAHRIGQTRNVVYIDITAADTIDERITANLQSKKGVAAVVLGDAREE